MLPTTPSSLSSPYITVLSHSCTLIQMASCPLLNDLLPRNLYLCCRKRVTLPIGPLGRLGNLVLGARLRLDERTWAVKPSYHVRYQRHPFVKRKYGKNKILHPEFIKPAWRNTDHYNSLLPIHTLRLALRSDREGLSCCPSTPLG